MQLINPEPLQCLQAGRALAALAVTAFHLSLMMGEPRYGGDAVLWDWTQYGRLGVDFFFVLSGFVILHAHQQDIGQPSALPRYVWRRLVRVYPVYWLYTGGFAVLVLAGLGRHSSLPGDTLDWLSAWSLVRLTPAEPPLYVAWSLFHEMAFYALFALLILNRRLGLCLLAAWGLLCLWLGGHPGDDPGSIRLTYLSAVNLDFLLGAAACLLAQRIRPWAWLLLGGALLLGSIPWLWPLQSSAAYLLASTGMAAVLCALAILERERGCRFPGWWLRIGDASYSLYLLHLPIGGLLLKALSLMHLPVWIGPVSLAAAVLAATTALSVLAYQVVEAPLVRRLRSASRSHPAGLAGSAAAAAARPVAASLRDAPRS